MAFGDEAFDGHLHCDQRFEVPPRSRRFAILAKKPSTALSHEAEVAVKMKIQRGWRPS